MRLLPFIKLVYDLKFEQKPDYDKLKFMLTKILLDSNKIPDKQYDWMKTRTLKFLSPAIRSTATF